MCIHLIWFKYILRKGTYTVWKITFFSQLWVRTFHKECQVHIKTLVKFPLKSSFLNRCSKNSVEERDNCFICEIGLLFTKKASICRNMEPPTDSGRRGSGISLSINRGPAPASQNQRAKHQDYYPPMPHGYPSPYFMQAPPYPVLMNPPPLPTVSFYDDYPNRLIELLMFLTFSTNMEFHHLPT